MLKNQFDSESYVVDARALERTVAGLREARVALPTFGQLANPGLIPPNVRAAVAGVGADAADPLNLFRVHWYNGASRADVVDVPEHLVLPRELTGVDATIVVALGDRFPLIGAHKVLAAYGCLAPRLVSGRVRPDSSSGRLAVHRQLLPRRRRDLPAAGLPRRRRAARGHEPRALRLARALGRRPGRHRPHAGHREQRQGDLRQVQGARRRPRQRRSSTSSPSSGTTSSTTSRPARRSSGSSSRCTSRRRRCGCAPSSPRPARRGRSGRRLPEGAASAR